MAFDYAGAKAAGYTDQEIQSYLNNGTSGQPPPNIPGQTTPQQPPQQSSFLQGQGLPVAGSILAGTIGSLLGPEVGIPAAGAGYLGGDIIRKNLADILGVNRSSELSPYQNAQVPQQFNAPLSDIQNSIYGAGKQMALQGIGEGAAKVLGAIAHPIATVMAPARKALAESPAVIDMAKYLTDLLEQGKNQFALKGMSNVFQPAYNALSKSIRDQAAALTKEAAPVAENNLVHTINVPIQGPLDNSIVKYGTDLSGVSPSTSFVLPNTVDHTVQVAVPKATGDITQSGLNLPVSLADKIKSMLGNKGFQALEQYQRYGINPVAGEVDLAKLANTMLSGQIKQEVPQVVLPDKLATLLNYIPNQARSASYFLPGAAFGLGRSLRMGGNLVPSLLQHLIPEGGGYLNQLLPALLQSPNLFQNPNAQQ